jgi:ribosomal-protein-alanine N-acetyltransferase
MRDKPSRAPKIKLRGKRVFLRSPEPGDRDEFIELMKRSAPMFRGLVSPFKRGRKQFDDYLKRCAREDFFGFLICRSGDGVILGNVNLFNIVHRALQSGCIGYLVGAPFLRQGYATEAARLTLRFAFTKVKLHRVEANIQPGNAPSIALVKRSGFSKEGLSRRYIKIAGRWRDHERWALLGEDWRKRRQQGLSESRSQKQR